MRRHSRKRAAAEREYSRNRRVFLEDNPICARCGGQATEVHHTTNRSQSTHVLLDQTAWLSLCNPCHRHVTENVAEAIEQGYSVPSWQYRLGLDKL